MVGPGASGGPVSPIGAYGTAVPLDLPTPRGEVPLPLSIIYTGSSRVGAAGAGWDIPLSFVRRSYSTTRRKPGPYANWHSWSANRHCRACS